MAIGFCAIAFLYFLRTRTSKVSEQLVRFISLKKERVKKKKVDYSFVC
jgi:hypothetical protein